VDPGFSRGARKLARTSRVKKKKKKLQQQLAIEDRTYYHVQFAK
jgi:hypothetical protein